MIVYFDTSSLVKGFLYETHSDAVIALLNSLETRESASSILAYAEMRAALAAAFRSKRITEDELKEAKTKFEASWSSMRQVDVDEAIVRLSGALAEEHSLRGSDAVHLASALTLHRDLQAPVAFSAFDDRLLDAAVACGLDRV